jgi:hypothetical protein
VLLGPYRLELLPHQADLHLSAIQLLPQSRSSQNLNRKNHYHLDRMMKDLVLAKKPQVDLKL